MTDEYIPLPADWVKVAVTVPAEAPEVWQAMTDTERVSQWLGDLSAPMEPGRDLRIDFGDGDFFDIHVSDLRSQQTIGFRWRFLGVGPESVVRWSLAGGQGASTVTVDDSSPGRPPAEVGQLQAGWLDFLGRLRAYLATGESARYAWREVIDGSADLPATLWRPLRAEMIGDWMPLATDGSRPAWFFIVDADGPRRFAIEDWRLVPDTSLSFKVVIPAAGTTRCEVTVTPAGAGTRIAVSHDGWSNLATGDLQARTLRHQFAAAWREALRQAEELAERAPKPSA